MQNLKISFFINKNIFNDTWLYHYMVRYNDKLVYSCEKIRSSNTLHFYGREKGYFYIKQKTPFKLNKYILNEFIKL